MEPILRSVALILVVLFSCGGPFVLALLPLVSDRCNTRYQRMKEAENSSKEQR